MFITVNVCASLILDLEQVGGLASEQCRHAIRGEFHGENLVAGHESCDVLNCGLTKNFKETWKKKKPELPCLIQKWKVF